MKIIEPSYEILTKLHNVQIVQLLEKCARLCYKSEKYIDDYNSAVKFLKSKIFDTGHHAMLEHFNITVKFICNRGFTHELVRHRLCSYAQESTRYCNYSKDQHGSQITFIKPAWFVSGSDKHVIWQYAMKEAEDRYLKLIELGAKPQEARGVLPIDVKTEIIITANLREWRHIFKMRTSNRAHPSMQQLMRPLLKAFQDKVPVMYDDITY